MIICYEQYLFEIESIFNLRNLDEDCDYIAHLQSNYESIITEHMDKGNYKDARIAVSGHLGC